MEDRNQSLDLLRAVAMFMILSAHFLGWGGAVNSLTTHDFNFFVIMPIYFAAGIGNTLFFLLSGYFCGMPRLDKAVTLERKTAFYSFVITLIAFIAGLNVEAGWGVKYVIKSAFPILFNKYWFMSAYIILYAFSAVLYLGLQRLSNRMILMIIGVLLVNNTFLDDANMTLMQGLLAFIVGYYLRNANPFEKWTKGKTLIWYCLSLVVYAGERVAVRYLNMEHAQIDTMLRYVLLLWLSVLFFVCFEKLEVHWRWPSKVSKYVVAVYLISANPAIVHWLYEQVLNFDEMITRPWFIFVYLITNIAIFAVCIGIDYIVSRWNQFETIKIITVCKKFADRLEGEMKWKTLHF